MLSGLCAWNIYTKSLGRLNWLESGQAVIFSVLTAVSVVMFVALWKRDFSFLYVAEYTDRVLPLFYALTAFWAGQAGSLLFWAWMTALFGLAFSLTRPYARLSPETKLHFWMLYLGVEAFFLLLLTGPSNPFMRAFPLPMDGKGLNPLLQNPGMIFHPPLLFLGYAGFTVPACLGLAYWITGQEGSWLKDTRWVTMFSWVMLTAGIILGGWWSYMELGWGGYWAWDPVENASLIPWLSATAFVHTAVVETRRGSLPRTNVLLVCLTLLLCFFGTYLVRSGAVESLHAFGEGGVSLPLLIFLLFALGLTGAILAAGKPSKEPRPLADLMSRPGFLVILAWLFLALGLVVFLGTLWPVISRLWSQNPVGLDAGFYNKVCGPLFAVIGLLLAFCPWMSWGQGASRPKSALVALGVLILAGAGIYLLGFRKPVPMLAGAGAVASLASLGLLMATDKASRTLRGGLGAWILHAGLAMLLLGVAVSGPYQLAKEAIVSRGQTVDLGPYQLTYQGVSEVSTARFTGAKASIMASRDGRSMGELNPERRIYLNFPQPFAEVSVIPSLGDELYATLLAYADDGSASIKVSLNPLVNWVWIGGALMCLAGLACLGSRQGGRA